MAWSCQACLIAAWLSSSFPITLLSPKLASGSLPTFLPLPMAPHSPTAAQFSLGLRQCRAVEFQMIDQPHEGGGGGETGSGACWGTEGLRIAGTSPMEQTDTATEAALHQTEIILTQRGITLRCSKGTLFLLFCLNV